MNKGEKYITRRKAVNSGDASSSTLFTRVSNSLLRLYALAGEPSSEFADLG
jgi:hypothetical protein